MQIVIKTPVNMGTENILTSVGGIMNPTTTKDSYAYPGHWRSWNDWDDYASQYMWMYKDGRYYYDGENLMFRVCEPGTPNCFFFSIGR